MFDKRKNLICWIAFFVYVAVVSGFVICFSIKGSHQYAMYFIVVGYCLIPIYLSHFMKGVLDKRGKSDWLGLLEPAYVRWLFLSPEIAEERSLINLARAVFVLSIAGVIALLFHVWWVG
ncbi:hypothetical protein NU688_28890 [Variovorax sp. ZS18.2.2]|uniref:hypothetical protein n=1 Tax=Variovorax sp. ZS18.2.2 TaxID=2971255 RepID=UPI0021510D8D|nr:hypothetical protein [Variovorax sp. ZS18.2.2]MCR6480205.1 hypothetical protein [Variovorax sp. ZS18.2.2]